MLFAGGGGVVCGEVVGFCGGFAGQISLVACEEDGEVGRCEGPRVHEEGRERAEGVVRCDVVEQYGACCAAVVRSRDGAEALGAGCVPELQFHSFPAGACADFDDF